MDNWMPKIIQGDALTILKTLPDESVQCCMTSPPYWGLRDYGTAKWEGGNNECDHRHPAEQRQLPHGDGRTNDCYADERVKKAGVGAMYQNACGKCGAIRIDSQLGLEKTPEEYATKLVEIFGEVRRVLRDDGTLWLNLGDSYYNYRPGGTSQVKQTLANHMGAVVQTTSKRNERFDGIKEKDLVGIPWIVAFALRDDGWYLRSDIPWLKRNGMPESTRDRPTTTVEHLFLLAKSERYFYDAEAVRLPAIAHNWHDATGQGYQAPGQSPQTGTRSNPKRVIEGNITRFRRSSDWFFESWQGLLTGEQGEPLALVVNTTPFKGAHFAVFPEKLVEPCIKAGTSEKGCCPKCGGLWKRVVEKTQELDKSAKGSRFDMGKTGGRDGGDRTQPGEKTLGWQPSCSCGLEPVPCVVLDPFFGVGTVGVVARKLMRSYIGIELNLDYCKMAERRINGTERRGN